MYIAQIYETFLDRSSSLVGCSPRVVLDLVSRLVGGFNVRVVGDSVDPLPGVASEGLPKVLPLKILLVRAEPFLGGVGGVGSDEGGHLGQVGEVGQGSHHLPRQVFPFQGEDDSLHARVEALNLGVEPLHNVVLALEGGEEVEDAKVEGEEGWHGDEEKTADVEGGAALGAPDVTFPDGDDIADQRRLVAHLMEGRETLR